VDVSARLRNNQTSAFAQGTTNGDGYWIMALALQIDVGAPRFPSQGVLTVDRATAAVGDVLTYTAVIDNSAGTTNANNLTFYDTPAPGTSFVPNSFTVNGIAQAGANPVAGVPLGTIAAGTTATVRFQVRVDSLSATDQRINRARWTFDFVSCSGQRSRARRRRTPQSPWSRSRISQSRRRSSTHQPSPARPSPTPSW
jgi:large repetitive protein